MCRNFSKYLSVLLLIMFIVVVLSGCKGKEKVFQQIDTWNKKGKDIFFENHNNYEEALKCFDKALELDSLNIDAWRGKSIIFLTLNKDDEAIKCYDKILEIKPDDGYCLYNKGIILYNSSKFKEAFDCFNKIPGSNNGCPVTPYELKKLKYKALAMSRVNTQYERWKKELNNEKAIQITEDWLNGKVKDLPVPEYISQAKIADYDNTKLFIEFAGGEIVCLGGKSDNNIITDEFKPYKSIQENYVSSNKIGSKGNGDGQFSEPADVAVDVKGNIYIVDTGNNRIQIFDSSGKFINKFGSKGKSDGKFNIPFSIALNVKGKMYITDPLNDRIQMFEPSGKFITKWISTDYKNSLSSTPCKVALSPDNNVFILNYSNHIQKFNSNGKFLKDWLIYFETSIMEHPGLWDITIDSLGYVYVVYTIEHFEDLLISILKFKGNCNGKLDGSNVDVIGRFSKPISIVNKRPKLKPSISIAIDLKNNIYVADSIKQNIQKFDSNRHFITKWDFQSSYDGQSYWGVKIAVDSNENVYVVNPDTNTIEKFILNK